MMATLRTRIRKLEESSDFLRTRTGLGGSHSTVTCPPLDALDPFTGSEPFAIGGREEVHLYFHVAFCEFVCPFCHYHRSYTSEKTEAPAVAPYLKALAAEIEQRRPSLAEQKVASVYLGGGTPTALSEERLAGLLAQIGTLADLHKANFSVETSPMTASGSVGRRKLTLLREVGAERISIGVQSFDPPILQAQRGHGVDVLNNAFDNIRAVGGILNIDLIQDLPLQNKRSIEKDLRAIEALQPDQVTWYTLREHKGSALHNIYHSKSSRSAAKLASIAAPSVSVINRLAIIQGMEALGYQTAPGGRFLKESAGQAQDIYKQVRGGLSRNLLGFGASAYSHGWGYFFRNVVGRSVMDGTALYIDRLKAGQSPVGSLMPLTELELAAGRACEAARTFIPDALLDRDDPTGVGWRAIIERGVHVELYERAVNGYLITRLGQLFEEELASLFYSEPVRQALWQRAAYWAQPGWFEPLAAGSPSGPSLMAVA